MPLQVFSCDMSMYSTLLSSETPESRAISIYVLYTGALWDLE